MHLFATICQFKKDATNTYDIVDYGLGGGTYTVELYKCVQQGTKKGLAKMPQTFTNTATYSEASYSSATRTTEVAKIGVGTLDEALRGCFEIKNTKGVEATAPYTIDMLGNADAGYVYVKSFTFFDSLGDGSYAAYTVLVNTSVKVEQ